MLGGDYNPAWLSVIVWRGYECAVYDPPGIPGTIWERTSHHHRFWLDRAREAIASRNSAAIG